MTISNETRAVIRHDENRQVNKWLLSDWESAHLMWKPCICSQIINQLIRKISAPKPKSRGQKGLLNAEGTHQPYLFGSATNEQLSFAKDVQQREAGMIATNSHLHDGHKDKINGIFHMVSQALDETLQVA